MPTNNAVVEINVMIPKWYGKVPKQKVARKVMNTVAIEASMKSREWVGIESASDSGVARDLAKVLQWGAMVGSNMTASSGAHSTQSDFKCAVCHATHWRLCNVRDMYSVSS